MMKVLVAFNMALVCTADGSQFSVVCIIKSFKKLNNKNNNNGSCCCNSETPSLHRTNSSIKVGIYLFSVFFGPLERYDNFNYLFCSFFLHIYIIHRGGVTL